VSSIRLTKFKKLPASQQLREHGKDFFVSLGHANFRMQEQTPIGIASWEDMKKHVYILGGTGSGKSETLKTILHSILERESDPFTYPYELRLDSGWVKDFWALPKTAMLIIDPKNDFATDLLTMIPEGRKKDVVYFNPQRQKNRPLAFPFFSKFSGDKTDEEKLEFLISIMKRFVQIDSSYSWGPELENILRQLFATAFVLPQQSLSGLDLLLHQQAQIKNLVRYLPDRLKGFWQDSILNRTNNDLAKYLATTNNKLGKFLDYPEFMNIVDRQGTKISFEDMINTGKIFIANLGSSSEQMKKYYSVYLTAHIAEAIFGQARLDSQDRKPCVFVVDEFQRVASDIFETLFSEVRAFNTALVISNQFMGQLDIRIQKSIESNIATKIFTRTQSVDDAEIAEKILGGKALVEDIINLPTGTAYIKTLVEGTPQDALSINIKKTEHPKDNAKETEDYFINQTMEKYGTPIEDILKERTTINSLYYSSDKEKEFHEAMGKGKNSDLPEESLTQNPANNL
jgi:DNA helicase HerA-like ATPase